jgi:hypothetical protein
LWADKGLRVDIANSTASCCPSGIVVFAREEFAKIVQQIVTPADELTKEGAAKAALAELIRMMDDPNQRRPSKDKVFDDFAKRWPALSRRDFDLCWKIACQKTKSGWDKRGRIPERKASAA